MITSLTHRRIPLATLLTALIGLIAALVVSACNASARGASGDSAQVTVSDNTLKHSVPKGFLGISMEETSLTQYAGRNPSAIDPGFIQLLHNLQPSGGFVLRLGGDSTDWGWWPIPGESTPAGIRFALTPTFAADAHNVAQQLGGKVLLGVNFEANSAKLAAYEAKELISHVGSSTIAGLELGNEPELYSGFAWYHTKSGVGVKGRPKSWDLSEYYPDFAHILAALPKGAPIAGPDSGSAKWLAALGTFASKEPRVSLLTIHAYPLLYCNASMKHAPSALFTTKSLQGLADNIARHVAAGTAHHRAVRIDEMNAISCGGQPGLSNAFAPALWALDMLPRLVGTGASGVNFHTVPNTIQDILSASKHGSSWSVGVQPEYYGLLAFAQAAPNGSKLLRTHSANSKLDAWAARTSAGVEHVVLINTGSGALTESVKVDGASGSGSVSLLQAPHGMLSTSGTTLGGQKISSSTGALSGTSNAKTVKEKNGVYSVRVPGSSAAILTIG